MGPGGAEIPALQQAPRTRGGEDGPGAADGGRDGDRTHHLIIANDALSQLSYAPIIRRGRAQD